MDTILKLNAYFVVRWLAKIIKGLSSKSEGCDFNSSEYPNGSSTDK